MINNNWRAAYSAGATSLLVGTALVANQSPSGRDPSFDEITVQRINIVEPDGTLRMVISNEKRLPGIIRHGKERTHQERRAAGMIFYNNEATEAGGLIFGGGRDEKGKPWQGLNLTFDQYDQDQTVQLTHQDDNGRRVSGLVLSDRPETPIPYEIIDLPAGPARTRRLEEAEKAGAFGRQRVVIAKTAESSFVSLRDSKGRPRLVMKVSAAGDAAVEFLDEDGNVQQRIIPTAGTK